MKGYGDGASKFGTVSMLLGRLVPLHISVSDFGSRKYMDDQLSF